MEPRLEHRYPQFVMTELKRIIESGSFRERAQYDLIGRPQYTFGLLTAADIAKAFDFKRVTVIEFGVANGDGLFNLCELAPQVTEETGVLFDIIGFDNAVGLPAPRDYRDHPEIWSQGDFTMTNREDIEAQLPSFAKLVIGDVSEALPLVIQTLSEEAPIGFIAHDMDVYSSTAASLAVYEGEASKLLPVSIAYFDDTLGGPGRMGSLFRNQWCGQLLAINEFNERNTDRKIDFIRTLNHRRPLHRELWLEQIYGVHALDHPFRNKVRRQSLSMSDHSTTKILEWAY